MSLTVFQDRRFAEAPGMNIGLAGTGCFANQSGRPMRHARWAKFSSPHLIVRGAGWLRTPAGETHLRAGDLFCPLQGEFVEYADHPDSPWEYYWVSLSGDGAFELVEYGGFSSQRHSFHASDPAPVEAAWERLLQVCATAAHQPLRVFAHVLELMASIREADPIPEPNPEEPPLLLRRAHQLAEEALHPLNVEELASTLGVHRATLHRAFVVGLGTTPIAWVRQRRHEHAKRLLAETDLKIAAVAQACGFADPKHFLRAFRQIEGITPATYRRQWV